MCVSVSVHSCMRSTVILVLNTLLTTVKKTRPQPAYRCFQGKQYRGDRRQEPRRHPVEDLFRWERFVVPSCSD